MKQQQAEPKDQENGRRQQQQSGGRSAAAAAARGFGAAECNGSRAGGTTTTMRPGRRRSNPLRCPLRRQRTVGNSSSSTRLRLRSGRSGRVQRQPRRWHDDDDATGEEEVESASLPVTATKAAPTMAPRPRRQPVGSVRNRWQPPNSTRSMPSSQSVQAVPSYRTAPIRTTAAGGRAGGGRARWGGGGGSSGPGGHSLVSHTATTAARQCEELRAYHYGS